MFVHYGFQKQIDGLLKRKVVMKNGTYLVIDRTEALTVIDVNTGKFVGNTDLEQTVFETNMVATAEIAKQLRLRNIGVPRSRMAHTTDVFVEIDGVHLRKLASSRNSL